MSAPVVPGGMLIVADDLSGAADCGIACTVAGLDTVVLLDAAGDPVRADVIAVDADTRRKPTAEAAAATARIVHTHAVPGQILFKKLDSTLRGNVGAEIAAALAARRALHADAVAIMAPAFPATGRTTSGGHQLLHGVRLEHTELWKAERIAGEAHIPAMLAAAGLRATAIHLDVVRDTFRLPAALSEAAIGHDVIVCDADAEADLQAIATASMGLGPGTVWAGSAGLARHLPAAAGLQRHRPLEPPPPCAGPLLFVVGSASRVSREQVAQLAAAPDVELVTVPPAVLRAGAADWHAWRTAVETALAAGHDTVVLLGSEGGVNLAEGLPLCLALAALVAPCADRAGALVLTGGETARAVLLALGATGLRLAGELEPGVPLSTAIGRRGLPVGLPVSLPVGLPVGLPMGMPVITKAGAFGHPGTLLRCRAALRSAPGAVNPTETS
jgi:4-hydroxythreonine-4-phosphate dehydrogenase